LEQTVNSKWQPAYVGSGVYSMTISDNDGNCLYILVTIGGGGNSLSNGTYSSIYAFIPYSGYFAIKTGSAISAQTNETKNTITISCETETLLMRAYKLSWS